MSERPADVSASLPDSQRENFRNALGSMVDLEVSGDWASVYDRFYDNEQGLTKEAFVKQRHHLQVLGFVPISATYIPPSELWWIKGCAEFSPPMLRHKDGIVSAIQAKLIDGKWRFSAPSAIAPDDEGRVLSCPAGLEVRRYVTLPAHSQASVPPVLLWDKGSYASWVPNQIEIQDLEANLSRISELKIRGYESTSLRIENPEKYFRQYVGVKHNGKRRIYINAFLDDSPPSDWRSHLYVVIDGDMGYWHGFYDPDTKSFSDLTINARA